MDKDKKPRRLTISVGPLGLSLLAAGITAVGLAAVSLADSGGGSNGSGSGGTQTQTFSFPGRAGGMGAVTIAGPNLSDADRQKLEDFRQCMQDNGAPAPPAPGDIGPGKAPPKPPTAADRDKLEKAWEACKDKLPDAMKMAGPPQLRVGGCAAGPPPGAPERGKQQNQDQSDSSGTSTGGTSS